MNKIKPKHYRLAAIRAIGNLYERHGKFDGNSCAYCGSPRQCLDHVPPLDVAYYQIDLKKFQKTGGKLYLIPSCNLCNELLGAKKLFTYDERLAFLFERYAKLIREHKWDDEEIEEMGPGLKAAIIESERHRQEYIRKLRGVENSILSCSK